ncbi:MAG TPA: phage tail protein [Acetobacteraceae bacterium]|jgi:phage tail-like protein|nr:phage tail protein [Acetobacteraceae bacterium]
MAVSELPLGFRFGVFFFVGGLIPNPIDIRFQRVSGLTATVQVRQLSEGGQNLYAHRFPESVTYENLVLERSAALVSPLDIEFNVAMSLFKFSPSNVLVTLFDDQHAPLAGWMFLKAFPVKWSTSDLDAGRSGLVIDTMELAYTRMQIVRA